MERENNNGNTVLLTVIGVATLLVALVGATFAYFTATITNRSTQSVSLSTATPVGLIYEGHSLQLLNAVPGEETLDPNNHNSSGSGLFTVTNPRQSQDKTVTNTVDQTYDLSLVVTGNNFTTTHTLVSDDPDDAAGTRKTYSCALNTTSKKMECTLGSTAATYNENTLTNQTNQLVATITVLDTVQEGTTTVVGTAGHTPTLTKVGDSAVFNVDTTNNIATIDLTDGTRSAKVDERFQFVQDQRIYIGETQQYNIFVQFLNTGVNQNENQGHSFSGYIDITDYKNVTTN